MAEKVEVLNIDFTKTAQSAEEAADEIVNLKNDIDKLKGALDAVDEGTDAYNQTLDKLGQKQEALQKSLSKSAEGLQQTNEEMMTTADVMQNTVGLAAGISGAFEAAEGALKLFGVENEAVTEAVERLMGLMAMTQGLQAIAEGIESFKKLNAAIKATAVTQRGLNIAMSANPLGGILKVAGLVTTAIWGLSKAFEGAADSAERMNTANENLKTRIEALNDEAEFGFEMMKAQGKTELEILNARLEHQKTIHAEASKAASDEFARLRRVKGAYEDWSEEEQKAYEELVKTSVEEEKKETAIQRQIQLQKTIQETLEKNKKITKDTTVEVKETEKAVEEIDIRLKDKPLEIPVKIVPLSGKLTQKDAEREIESISRTFESNISKIDKYESAHASIWDSFANSGRTALINKQQRQILNEKIRAFQEYSVILQAEAEKIKRAGLEVPQELIDNINNAKEAIQGFGIETQNLKEREAADTIQDVATQMNLLVKFTDDISKFGGEVGEIWGGVFGALQVGLDGVSEAFRQAAEDEKKMKDANDETMKGIDSSAPKWKKYGAVASASLDVATQLMATLADQQDTSTREGFESQKKYQMAGTVTSTLSGIVNAWASAMQLPFPVNIIAGTLLSGMMGTIGALNLENISRTKYGDNSLNGISGAGASNISVSALQSLGQGVSATTSIEGASAEGSVKDTRVYVLESDITNTQNRVRTIESETTF